MFDDSCYMEPLHLAGRLIMENGGETLSLIHISEPTRP